ncbi:MAG: YtcA family lipoprotein [Pseudomonadota bacterium]
MHRHQTSLLPWIAVIAAATLAGCSRAPSRNILGSYFPSWMVCALGGIAIALIARAFFKKTGLLEEIPVPFVVIVAIACAATFALWLLWLA